MVSLSLTEFVEMLLTREEGGIEGRGFLGTGMGRGFLGTGWGTEDGGGCGVSSSLELES